MKNCRADQAKIDASKTYCWYVSPVHPYAIEPIESNMRDQVGLDPNVRFGKAAIDRSSRQLNVYRKQRHRLLCAYRNDQP